MNRALYTLAIFIQLLVFTGCQINIDTKPQTTTSSQKAPNDEELTALKDELNEIKESNREQVQALEAELEQLKAQNSSSQRKIAPYQFAEARALAEEYVLEHTNIKNKSDVVFKTLSTEQQENGIFAAYGDGANFSGYFVFSTEGRYNANQELNEWKKECDDLYAGDTKKGQGYTIYFSLCFSSKGEHYPIFVRIIEEYQDSSAAKIVLTENFVVMSENAKVLNAFVEANKKVSPL